MPAPPDFRQLASCPQRWDAMAAEPGGRRCGQCDKLIHDFRGMAPREIGLVHADQPQAVCGIYDAATLAAQPRPSACSATSRGSVLLASALSMLTTGAASAQGKVPAAPPVEVDLHTDTTTRTSTLAPPTATPPVPLDSTRQVSGTITDATGAPLPGVTVLEKGSKNGTVSDVHGQFTLFPTRASLQQDSLTLIMSYIGFDRVEHAFPVHALQPDKPYPLNASLTADPELIAFSIIETPPKRRFWQRIGDWFRRE